MLFCAGDSDAAGLFPSRASRSASASLTQSTPRLAVARRSMRRGGACIELGAQRPSAGNSLDSSWRFSRSSPSISEQPALSSFARAAGRVACARRQLACASSAAVRSVELRLQLVQRAAPAPGRFVFAQNRNAPEPSRWRPLRTPYFFARATVSDFFSASACFSHWPGAPSPAHAAGRPERVRAHRDRRACERVFVDAELALSASSLLRVSLKFALRLVVVVAVVWDSPAFFDLRAAVRTCAARSTVLPRRLLSRIACCTLGGDR